MRDISSNLTIDYAGHSLKKILALCVQKRASDLHIQPKKEYVHVRVRIDGFLETLYKLPLSAHTKLISRLKLLCQLDLSESHVPLDGACTVQLENSQVDLRAALFPTTLGEAAAIRINDSERVKNLCDLGLGDHGREIFERMIDRPNGIILVTGPTGSGKTTSLYAALNHIDREAKQVLTVEDPCERELAGVVQTQVNTKLGITFPVVLRSMLREDPDVIMVGEIRDQETAEIALRAAMTGHLVFSTLHTNTAIGAIARLKDLGLDTYLVASTIGGLMSQRLVRKICPNCVGPDAKATQKLLSISPKARGLAAYKGKGCSKCNHKGYLGRLGIFEIIPVDEEFRVLIDNSSPEVRLYEKAATHGYKTMLEDGIDKIGQGLTTLEEVLSVCKRY